MSMTKQAVQQTVRDIVEQTVKATLASILPQLTAKQAAEESPKTQQAVEPECSPSPDTEESDCVTSLKPQDICYIGLGLVRLQEAAEEYIASDGEEEADTFPAIGQTPAELDLNMDRVRKLKVRANQLVAFFADIYQRMTAPAFNSDMLVKVERLHALLKTQREGGVKNG